MAGSASAIRTAQRQVRSSTASPSASTSRNTFISRATRSRRTNRRLGESSFCGDGSNIDTFHFALAASRRQRHSLIREWRCRRLAASAKWNVSMLDPSPQNDDSPKRLLVRLDRVAREMNVFLLVLALGLAVLDLTCLWAVRMADALPAMARSHATGAVTP